jgi:hypothetical protein
VVRIRSSLESKQSSCLQAAQSPWLGCGVVNTTATQWAAGGVDELGQELAAPSRQAQTQHTQEHTVLPQFHPTTWITPSKRHGVTWSSRSSQEEKVKPTATAPGGAGQGVTQEEKGKQEQAATQQRRSCRSTTRSHHQGYPAKVGNLNWIPAVVVKQPTVCMVGVIVGFPQISKEMLCSIHHWK